jgi:hypothetical protein
MKIIYLMTTILLLIQEQVTKAAN